MSENRKASNFFGNHPGASNLWTVKRSAVKKQCKVNSIHPPISVNGGRLI